MSLAIPWPELPHRPVRVLALIKGLDRGGAEMLLADAAERVDRRQVALTVARVVDDSDALVPRLARAGVASVSLGASSGADPRWPWRLRRLLRDGHFDEVHTYSPLPAAVARIVAPRGVRFLHTEHSTWTHQHPLTRTLNALTYWRVDEVVAVSHAVKRTVTPPRWLPRQHWPEIRVVHPTIDPTGRPRRPQDTPAARRLLGIPENAVVIGCVANFDPEKNHETLIDAFAELTQSSPQLVLALVGFGKRESLLRDRVKRAGISDRVLFLGPHVEVSAILPAFDVFALASTHEGYGLAVAEALAACLPVAATDIEGLRELRGPHPHFVLVPPCRPDALSRAIGGLLPRSTPSRTWEHL